jgi:hypothetical protein
MHLQTAQNVFAIRLYKWSQRDFLRELEEGCPLLSSIGLNDRRVAAFVMWTERLNSDERRELVIALTRRCHENAARLRGETMTERDKFWNQAVYEHTWGGFQEEHVPPLLTARRGDPDFQPLDAEACLDTLAASLPSIMGKMSRRKFKVICTKQIDDWNLITEFTLLRKEEELTFEYQFVRKDGSPVRNPHPAQGPFPRTLLFFYGLGFTNVQVPSRIDGERMAKVMPKLAEHFVSQATPLFAGLGINDPEEASN